MKLFFILMFVVLSCGQEASIWATRYHDIGRSGISQLKGPALGPDLEASVSWYWNDYDVGPIYIVGNSYAFRIRISLDTNDPEGNQLELFDLQSGKTIIAPNHISLQIYVAFPPVIDTPENRDIVACFLLFNSSNSALVPTLQCIRKNGDTAFFTKYPQLIANITASELYLGMEFLTSNLLLLTNRGTDVSFSNNSTNAYLLVNVGKNGEVVWQKQNIFETIDHPFLVPHFSPTIWSTGDANWLYLTNTSMSLDHSITAFNFDMNSGNSVPQWSKTFLPPDFPTGLEYSIVVPVICETRNNQYILITALSHISSFETVNSYLIALDAQTGNLLWSHILPEAIMGYVYDRNNDVLYVTTSHKLVSFKNLRDSTQEWEITFDTKTETSPPTLDQSGFVYICNSGSIRGYNNFGTVVYGYDHNPSGGRYCDQPIILDNAILIRTERADPTNATGIFLSSVRTVPPSPTAPPSTHEDKSGLIIGLVIGGLAILALILLIIRISKRRRDAPQYDSLG
jgi:outer membrane protein assembly factor BamB